MYCYRLLGVNLQIVWSQFFTDMLLIVYIQSTSNIYWFICIQIRCQWIQTNSYSVTFNYSQYLVQHSMNNPEGKKTIIRCYLITIVRGFIADAIRNTKILGMIRIWWSFVSKSQANPIKLFYGCNLQIYVMTWNVCPWQAFPALSHACRYDWSLPEWSTFQMLYSRVGSLPYPQTLD